MKGYPVVALLIESLMSCLNEFINSHFREGSYWMIEAFPDVVVPGHESVVILLKHSPRLELHEDVNNSSGIHDKRDSNSNTKQNEKLALVALLRIFTSDEKGNKNIIHEKTWKINQNELWDDSSSISFYKEREHRSERGTFL